MFLRLLGVFVALLALVWVVMYVTASSSMRDALQERWPYSLGSVADLEKPADTHPASKEAKEIMKLIDALSFEEPTPDDYVAAQIAKKDDAIDPLPADAGLKGHEAQVTQIARAVVDARDRIRWDSAGAPWELEETSQFLAAAALDRARNGDAAGAWEHATAIWLLARSASLRQYSAEMSLTMKRLANALARKLPPPAPPWTAELTAFDPRRDTAAQIQQSTASRVRTMTSLRGPLIVLKPISDMVEASNIRASRAAAEVMAKAPRCRIDTSQEFEHTAEVYRASRIDAELEATAKMLALKAERARLGRWPAALPGGSASRCAGNHWEYGVEADGSRMKLWMSFPVAAEPDAKSAPALQFEY